jgi:hypothetical protein
LRYVRSKIVREAKHVNYYRRIAVKRKKSLRTFLEKTAFQVRIISFIFFILNRRARRLAKVIA